VNTHHPHADDNPATASVLAALQNDFPQFHIWSENTLTGRRYIARSRHLGQNPHTLVTPDPGELRAVLDAARTQQPRSTGPRLPAPPTLPRRRPI
jgi:hypothetical protein